MNITDTKTFLNENNIEYKESEQIGPYTTIKIGGEVDFLVDIKDLAQLKKTVSYLNSNSIEYKILGNGSNLLISDKGYKGVMIRLIGEYFKRLTHKDNVLETGAGVNLTEMLRYCVSNSLGGLEFFAGVPGTIGGAIVMNAGTKKSISDVIKYVYVMDAQANIMVLSKQDIMFSYRESQLKDFIILGVSLSVEQADARKISQEIKKMYDYKKNVQDYSLPSAGCVFKNIEQTESVGLMIEKAGLKGLQIGDAMISDVHGNFIVNKGNAKSSDILELINIVKEKLYEKYNVELELELEVV